jgi:hypothetical protein
MNSADRALSNAFREIGDMAERLNLPRMVAVGLNLIVISCTYSTKIFIKVCK